VDSSHCAAPSTAPATIGPRSSWPPTSPAPHDAHERGPASAPPVTGAPCHAWVAAARDAQPGGPALRLLTSQRPPQAARPTVTMPGSRRRQAPQLWPAAGPCVPRPASALAGGLPVAACRLPGRTRAPAACPARWLGLAQFGDHDGKSYQPGGQHGHGHCGGPGDGSSHRSQPERSRGSVSSADRPPTACHAGIPSLVSLRWAGPPSSP
jgi:hypothetical protein